MILKSVWYGPTNVYEMWKPNTLAIELYICHT
eukprot:UN08616